MKVGQGFVSRFLISDAFQIFKHAFVCEIQIPSRDPLQIFNIFKNNAGA